PGVVDPTDHAGDGSTPTPVTAILARNPARVHLPPTPERTSGREQLSDYEHVTLLRDRRLLGGRSLPTLHAWATSPSTRRTSPGSRSASASATLTHHSHAAPQGQAAHTR